MTALGSDTDLGRGWGNSPIVAAVYAAVCGAFVCAAGCDFDESVTDLRCDVAGAERGERVCRNGRWVVVADAVSDGGGVSCEVGETRQSSETCGSADRGTWRQRCVDGAWKNVECEGGWYESCDAYLRAHPDAESGEYVLDIDGTGDRDPARAYCRMDEHGWTLVALDDFDDGADGWTSEARTDCGSLGMILGGFCQFGGGEIKKTYRIAAVPHDRAELSLNFVQIDSWDGGDGDRGYVQFEETEIWGERLSGGEGDEECGIDADFARESVTTIRGTIQAGQRREYQVTVGANLDEFRCNESWGIDDVRIFVR